MNSSPARRASSGRGARAAGELGVDDDAQAVGDHDQQLVAAGMAEAVVDHLEAVEVDEQHRRAARRRAPRSAACRLRSGNAAGWEATSPGRTCRAHGHFRSRREPRRTGCRPPPRAWAWSAGPIAGAGETRSPSSTASSRSLKRGERAGAFAVGPFGGDVADQQAEGAGDERCEDLLVELRQVEERGQREEEGGEARRRTTGSRC